MTNFTDAVMKMCIGDLGQKCKKLVSMIQGINFRPITSKPNDQKGPLDSLT